MSCSRTQRSDAGEARTHGPSVSIKHSADMTIELMINATKEISNLFSLTKIYIVSTIKQWKKTDLLALLYVMFSGVFCHFTMYVLGQVWYLIISIPDLCLLPYLGYNHKQDN